MTEWNEDGVRAGDFEAFRQIVAALRSENGCPWDRKQTFESLKPCMINEMTEAVAAVNIYEETQDAENLCEELGDVLLQVVLMSQIAEEKGLFCARDVISGISRKMIRRHPHVFGEDASDGSGNTAGAALTAQEVPGRWEAIKQAEKKNQDPAGKQREKEAFLDAAQEITAHLEKRKSLTNEV